MAQAVSAFFGLLGPNVTAPTNMQELIPYLLNFFVGVVLVAVVFRLIGVIASTIVDRGRF
nr:MAG TPA: hypothetical protein [Inoviridae sp.]